jgi:hypothetical protein
MKKNLLYVLFLIYSLPINAGMIGFLNDEDGHTNWQHLANWSGGYIYYSPLSYGNYAFFKP